MRPKSILLVDDEHDIVIILKRALEKAGFSVFGFTDPLLALEHFKINASLYGLVLLDVRMPQISGIELARIVRKTSPTIRILLMSAFEMKDLNIEPSLAISDLLQKPLSPEELKNVVAKYLETIDDIVF